MREIFQERIKPLRGVDVKGLPVVGIHYVTDVRQH